MLTIMINFNTPVEAKNTLQEHNSQNNDDIQHFLLIGLDIPMGLVEEYKNFTEIVAILSVNWSTGAIRSAVFAPETLNTLLENQGTTFTTAYQDNGKEFFSSLLQKHYNFAVGNTIALDFDGALAIIDGIGGLEVEIIQEDLNQDLINSGITSPGLQTLSGQQTLSYISNITQGAQNNQNIRLNNISSAFNQKRHDLKLKNILNILGAISNNLDMDIKLLQIPKLIQKGLNFNLTESEQIFILPNTTSKELSNYLYFIK